MRQRIRSHLTYANVMATIAVFLVLSGGTAVALTGSNTVFSDDIVNGEVKVADIGQGAVATDEIANGQVQAADIGADQVRSSKVLDNNLTGADVAANSLKGADIDESTLDVGDAARAYARVVPADCTGTPGICIPDRAKGISSVTRDATGTYCVTAPGINSNATPAAVTVDWASTDGPEGNASAMADAILGCGPSGQGFRVRTERQPTILVDQAGGTNNALASGPADDANDVGFTIVIP
jgi:hypothetical protein